MIVTFAKWGHSVALRIPRAFAKEIQAHPGKAADISVLDGRLVVTPVETPVYTLDELLAGVTSENVHGETFAFSPVGNEVL
ncbi:MAG TPA: PbsX family transcriptional regulator [Pseudolabrys sp.]|nr:PbsX family transcriptional regulator [Pseudolabrys sp.]